MMRIALVRTDRRGGVSERLVGMAPRPVSGEQDAPNRYAGPNLGLERTVIARERVRGVRTVAGDGRALLAVAMLPGPSSVRASDPSDAEGRASAAPADAGGGRR